MSELTLLARRLGASERTLRRAANLGLLRAERMSERRLRLADGERRYLERRWPLLSGLRRALRTEPNVRLAVLFGSVARGDDEDGSDVDVFVDLRDGNWLRLAELEERVSRAVARDIRLMRLADAQNEATLLGEVLADGRVLLDRDDEWPGLVQQAEQMRRRGELELRARALKAVARARSR